MCRVTHYKQIVITLINKIQYYAGDYGIGDASTSLAWNNFADYFVDNYRGVVCRFSQDGIIQ